jgi:hypothetical protein
MHSYENNAKFAPCFLATALSDAILFWRKWGEIENFKNLSEFEKDF